MSSSSKVLHRLENPDLYSFGPWYDHYVRPTGKCHPDWDTILIGANSGDPRGVKVCVRRPYALPDYTSNNQGVPIEESGPQLYRYSRRLYEPSSVPLQQFNTSPRVPPNEAYNLLNDYYKLSPDYNGTGLYMYRTCKNVQEAAFN